MTITPKQFLQRPFPPSPLSSSTARILRLREVCARVGLSRSSIYLHMNRGEFPQSINLGARARGWIESEIDAWLSERIQARLLSGADREWGATISRSFARAFAPQLFSPLEKAVVPVSR